MKDNQNKYLDKVVELLVKYTVINYGKEEIQLPFFYSRFLISTFSSLSVVFRFKLFSEYCKEVYGLTDLEIDYVWKEYKDIILDKIKNGK